jgi:hypothetical protein
MRRVTWERYVPDFPEDNREKARRKEPALAVMIRPPSAAVWRQFFIAMSENKAVSTRLATMAVELKSLARATGIMVQLATLHDDLAETLWLPCVGKYENFVLESGEVVEDGRQHWALKDEIDGPDLYQDILGALIIRARLDEGLASFLASESGPPASDLAGSTRDGTAASVGAAG